MKLGGLAALVMAVPPDFSGRRADKVSTSRSEQAPHTAHPCLSFQNQGPDEPTE